MISLNEKTKTLSKAGSTSIIVKKELLENSENLTRVGENRDNVYYLIDDSQSVIMHVEQDFAIICDYVVNGVNLPQRMLQKHYGVYQFCGRDWVKNTVTSRLIGYDIKRFLYGNECQPDGTTLDHVSATFDERDKYKEFSKNNVNHGSHRVQIIVRTQEELNRLLTETRVGESSSFSPFLKK